MLVRVKKEEASLLRELEVATYQETFGPFIKEADMAHYFDNELSLATIEKELADPESETYFVVKGGEIAGFLKVTGDRLKQSKNCHRPLRFSEFTF